MDTTNPEENINTSTQAPLLTAEGRAVSKQITQEDQQIRNDTSQEDEQPQPQNVNPVGKNNPNDDEPYRVPGEIALEQIEEENLPKQEDKKLFHTPVTAVTQDDFISIHTKTRRAYHDVTRHMTNTKTVINNYYITARGDPPTKTKILMEDLLPAHGHKWHIRSALAFKAAVLHLKKEHMPVTGPTDEKTLY